MKMLEKKRAQGATEYLLMLAAVLVIVAVAVYYVMSTGGYPTISVTAATDDSKDNTVLTVTSGSIAKADWAYCINTAKGATLTWTTGGETLDAPSVSLENSLSSRGAGTYYVSLKHIPSGHIYFTDTAVTIE